MLGRLGGTAGGLLRLHTLRKTTGSLVYFSIHMCVSNPNVLRLSPNGERNPRVTSNPPDDDIKRPETLLALVIS